MFANIVSIGSSCVMAASMAKYGFRNWSGPFDWIVTQQFEYVLSFMENDFSGFLQKENLRAVTDCENVFEDTSCGFLFKHDGNLLDPCIYEQAYQKYQNRIKRFLIETEKETCFLRYIKWQSQFDYVLENVEYIRSIIKRRNKNSIVVFPIGIGLQMPKKFPFPYFEVFGHDEDKINDFLNHSQEFIRFCFENYDKTLIAKNLAWQRKARIKLEKETK